MLSPIAHPTTIVPRAHFARAAAAAAQLWRAFVDAARAFRIGTHTSARNAVEREALVGLGEHVLKDIGASSWLVADSAMRKRDDFQARIDIGMY